MRIGIVNESKQGLGGGWSFIDNFIKGLIRIGDINTPLDICDIVLIPSASMVKTSTVELLKKEGKKIVLRIDNIPRNSRNRGSGTSRLFDIAQLADGIVYQSKWAYDYIQPFVKKTGKIIYNGVDTSIFNPDKKQGYKDFGKYDQIFLYSRYSRDETKSWERAWYDYQMIHRSAKALGTTTKLVIVGRFSDEVRENNFDFYNGEVIQYYGIAQEAKEMAQVLRGCNTLIAPYFNDAYSNTIQEAIACGLQLRVEQSGGTPEVVGNGVIKIEDMVKSYVEYFNELLS